MKSIKYILSLVMILGMATVIYGQTPDEMEIDRDIIRMHELIMESKHNQLATFLNNGGNVNAVDEIGNTALHLAAKVGDRPTIDLLIRKGAKIDKSNMTGTTPLMIAAKYGNAYVVQKLLDYGANPQMKNNAEFTAYTFAERYEHQKIAKLLKPRM